MCKMGLSVLLKIFYTSAVPCYKYCRNYNNDQEAELTSLAKIIARAQHSRQPFCMCGVTLIIIPIITALFYQWGNLKLHSKPQVAHVCPSVSQARQEIIGDYYDHGNYHQITTCMAHNKTQSDNNSKSENNNALETPRLLHYLPVARFPHLEHSSSLGHNKEVYH